MKNPINKNLRQRDCDAATMMQLLRYCDDPAVAKLEAGGMTQAAPSPAPDSVNHPSHYTASPARCTCGRTIECIDVTEHLDFLRGNIIKYAWRAGLKTSTSALEDLKKCLWYAQRAVEREEKRQSTESGAGN